MSMHYSFSLYSIMVRRKSSNRRHLFYIDIYSLLSIIDSKCDRQYCLCLINTKV